MLVKRRQLILPTLVALIALVSSSPASASGALSQGFTTDSATLSSGSLAVLQPDQQNKVSPATSDQATQLVGVTANKSLVELGDGTKEIQVVVSGQTSALVSDINGDIKVGDKITASPVSGVGMKATNSTEVVGTAQSNFNSSNATKSSIITDKSGNKKLLHIGRVTVQVNVSYYAVSQDKFSSIVPAFLVSSGSAIAGKDVSPVRILIGFTCLLIGFLVGGVILQAAVRSGIISLGRNPLAQNTLRRGLIDVMIMTTGLLILTIIVFYLILTL